MIQKVGRVVSEWLRSHVLTKLLVAIGHGHIWSKTKCIILEVILFCFANLVLGREELPARRAAAAAVQIHWWWLLRVSPWKNHRKAAMLCHQTCSWFPFHHVSMSLTIRRISLLPQNAMRKHFKQLCWYFASLNFRMLHCLHVLASLVFPAVLRHHYFGGDNKHGLKLQLHRVKLQQAQGGVSEVAPSWSAACDVSWHLLSLSGHVLEARDLGFVKFQLQAPNDASPSNV